MNKYNYIVICRDNEIYDYAYSDLNKNTNSYFDNHFPHSKLKRMLYIISFSSKLSRFFKHTGKHFWIKKRIEFLKKKTNRFVQKKLPICFVLFSDCLVLEKYDFSDELRREFTDCKIVYFFQDIVSKDTFKKKFLEMQRKKVDAIISFDYMDAEKYGLYFYNIPYSTPIELNSKKNIYDICFVGLAKDRMKEILDAYEYLSGKGLKCDFHIVGAKDSEKKYGNVIDYCKPMNYYQYLNVLNQSKCILEIIQKGGTGSTIRVDEAIMYNKYLLSNNENLVKNAFYCSEYMRVYRVLGEEDLKFLMQEETVVYSKEIKEKISPNALLDFIGTKVLS